MVYHQVILVMEDTFTEFLIFYFFKGFSHAFLVVLFHMYVNVCNICKYIIYEI